jgi:hypothetical protein
VYLLLHVVDYRRCATEAVRAPVVSILGWFSEGVPDKEAVDRLTYINQDGYLIGGHHLLCLAMPSRRHGPCRTCSNSCRMTPFSFRSGLTSSCSNVVGHMPASDQMQTQRRVRATSARPPKQKHRAAPLRSGSVQAYAFVAQRSRTYKAQREM